MPRPDRVIARRVREYEKHLYITFDELDEKWVIMRKPPAGFGKHERVMTVMNDDGSYRPLDQRVLTNIALADTHRYKSPGEMMRLMDERNKHIQESAKASVQSDLNYISRTDMYDAMNGTLKFGAPKGGWRTFK